MMNERIAGARARGEITEWMKVPEVRLSTKDQLKQMGININLSERGLDDLGDSVGDNASTGLDELDIDYLQSEDEDMAAQNEYKNRNLKQYGQVQRTDLERKQWHATAEDDGMYALVLNTKPDREYVKRVYKKTREKT